MEIENIQIKKPKHVNQLDLFLEGLRYIFKNWTAFRLCIDNNATLIFNNVIEVVNDKEEIEEELEFNIILGQIFENICSAIKNEPSPNFQEKIISELLKKFMEEYFFISLEDESNIDIARMIVKLFKEISSNKTDYLERIKNFKPKMEYNIEYPCKITTKINLEDYESDSDDEGEQEESDEEMKEEMKEIVEGKFKKTKNENLEHHDIIKEIGGTNNDHHMDIDDEGFEEVGKKKKK